MGGHHRETQGRTGFEFPDGPKHPRTIELAKKIEQATKMATIYGCMASLPAMLRSKVERGIMTLDKAIEHLRSGAGKKERLIYKGLSEKCNNRIVYCEGCSAGRSKKAAVSKRRNKLGIEAYKEHLGTPKEKAKITHEEYKQHRLKRIFEQDVVKKTIKRIVKESSGLNADDLEKVLEYIQFIKNRSPRPK